MVFSYPPQTKNWRNQRTLNNKPGWETALGNSGKARYIDRQQNSTPVAFEQQVYYEELPNYAEGATLKLRQVPLGG